MKVKHIVIPSTKIKVSFFKGNYEVAGTIYTQNDDIEKLKLPDDVNMVIFDYPNGDSKSYLIGEIVYEKEKNRYKQEYSSDWHGGPAKSWLKLFNGPTISYGSNSNIISPKELKLLNPKEIKHIAYTIEYPYTEGYIKKFILQNHDVREVKITDDILKTANFIELYDLTPDKQKINVEFFAIGLPLSIDEVKKYDKKAFEFMKKSKIDHAFMDSTQKVFPITEKDVKVLNPSAFNEEGFYEPERLSYLELE